jgi:exosortase
MSTVPAQSVARHAPIPLAGPLRVAALVAAFGWCYSPVLPGLAAQWWNEPEYSHGILVPFISAYLIWSRWDALRAAPVTPGQAGLGVMALATLMYIAGSVGADLFLQRTSFVVMLAGAVLFVLGPAVLRLVLFPLAFLFLMIPLPGILFNAIAFPLQLFAAQVASRVLEVCDVPVFREGNVMHLAAASLDVEEACSGIR